jgi:hypothetical protein
MALRCDYQALPTHPPPHTDDDGQNEHGVDNFDIEPINASIGDGGTKRGLQQRQ